METLRHRQALLDSKGGSSNRLCELSTEELDIIYKALALFRTDLSFRPLGNRTDRYDIMAQRLQDETREVVSDINQLPAKGRGQ